MKSAQLAIVLRQVQWELDEVAHRLPTGRVTKNERVALALRLVDVAELLKPAGDLDREGAVLIVPGDGVA